MQHNVSTRYSDMIVVLNTNMTCVSSSSFSFSSSFLDIQILEVVLAILVFVVIDFLRQGRRQGLPVWPIVGMLPSLVVGLRTNAYKWLTDVLCRTKGTFHFKGPRWSNLNCMVTADPRNVEHMLKTKFANFPKGEYFLATMKDLLGDGIFNADHDVWRKQRTTASLVFHLVSWQLILYSSWSTGGYCLSSIRPKLLGVLAPAEKEQGKALVAAVDLQDVLLRLTFDNVCMIALAVDPGCLRPVLPEVPLAKAFERATELTALRFVIPTCIWNAMRKLNVGPEKELKDSTNIVNEFADQVIKTRKKS
ncbi:hypothetical protein Cgig2_033080 [Carnegiea gigantea]|uniref:Cytochrome P450 n=1 Tax=Carnegiea gigantea TaxID=171969 RepID=A0A9Q1GUJ3_9CARY|nr:hypothetical protein Cgig2_033080 [Carnegiea gigantea]